MNKLTILCLSQLVAAAAAAQVPYLIYAEQTFKGKIDNQYEIVVQTDALRIEDESFPAEGVSLSGSYYYTNTQKPMNLTGVLYETDKGYRMELKYMKQENGSSTLSEQFVGDLSSDGQVWRGTWSKPSKDKKLSFSVERQMMPNRDLFMRFLETKIKEDAGGVFSLDLSESARFSVVDGMPFIKGLKYEGAGGLDVRFEEGCFSVWTEYERMGGGIYTEDTYQLLPSEQCTVLNIYSSADEQEMENPDNDESTNTCTRNVGVEVYQWDGGSWKKVTQKLFPSGAVTNYQDPEDAETCKAYIRQINESSFEIGATETSKVLWKWDGQRFAKG